MVLLRENRIEYVNLLQGFLIFKDEIKMLVIKFKNQNFKYNELKRRISSFIRY